MKGRPADWSATAAELPPEQLIPAAAAAGFNGLWIDRAAYEDRGAELEKQVQAITGASGPAVVSGDDRRVFYDLQPLQARLDATVPAADRAEIAAALTTPVEAEYGDGFYGPEKDEETHWRWANSDAVMTIANGTGRPQKVRFTTGLRSAVGSRTTITVDGTVVQEATFPAAESEPGVTLELTVPTSGVEVRFRTTGANLGPPSGDPRVLFLKLMEPRLVNETLERAERLAARDAART